MQEIIFVNSHPIQYFAPMYKYMNEQGTKTKAWYCSDTTRKAQTDEEFGIDLRWDIPLLEGYESLFFTNSSWRPSHNKGFFGLINLGMIRKLFSIQKAVIVVHGWQYCSHLLVLLLGKLKGHTICLRNDASLKQELIKKGWKQPIKRFLLRRIVFPRIDYFLYIGTQNRLFYENYGIAATKLVFCPYAVDNVRFRNSHAGNEKKKLKEKLGIPPSAPIILFSAKYIEKKRPLDLVKAFEQLNDPTCWLVMIGEGELRNDLEKYISQKKIQRIILTGFVNQTEIADYYSIGDVFVMCSSFGENWGLSVNEAMNFGLPLIISDLTGCVDDLVRDGINGYVFETGDVTQLTAKLGQVLPEQKLKNSPASKEIVDRFSYSTGHYSLRQLAMNN